MKTRLLPLAMIMVHILCACSPGPPPGLAQMKASLSQEDLFRKVYTGEYVGDFVANDFVLLMALRGEWEVSELYAPLRWNNEKNVISLIGDRLTVSNDFFLRFLDEEYKFIYTQAKNGKDSDEADYIDADFSKEMGSRVIDVTLREIASGHGAHFWLYLCEDGRVYLITSIWYWEHRYISGVYKMKKIISPATTGNNPC